MLTHSLRECDSSSSWSRCSSMPGWAVLWHRDARERAWLRCARWWWRWWWLWDSRTHCASRVRTENPFGDFVCVFVRVYRMRLCCSVHVSHTAKRQQHWSTIRSILSDAQASSWLAGIVVVRRWTKPGGSGALTCGIVGVYANVFYYFTSNNSPITRRRTRDNGGFARATTTTTTNHTHPTLRCAIMLWYAPSFLCAVRHVCVLFVRVCVCWVWCDRYAMRLASSSFFGRLLDWILFLIIGHRSYRKSEREREY